MDVDLRISYLQAIEWVKLSDLPTWRRQKRKVPGKKFYSVAPFVA